jgi:hypothetical protein
VKIGHARLDQRAPRRQPPARRGPIHHARRIGRARSLGVPISRRGGQTGDSPGLLRPLHLDPGGATERAQVDGQRRIAPAHLQPFAGRELAQGFLQEEVRPPIERDVCEIDASQAIRASQGSRVPKRATARSS